MDNMFSFRMSEQCGGLNSNSAAKTRPLSKYSLLAKNYDPNHSTTKTDFQPNYSEYDMNKENDNGRQLNVTSNYQDQLNQDPFVYSEFPASKETVIPVTNATSTITTPTTIQPNNEHCYFNEFCNHSLHEFDLQFLAERQLSYLNQDFIPLQPAYYNFDLYCEPISCDEYAPLQTANSYNNDSLLKYDRDDYNQTTMNKTHYDVSLIEELLNDDEKLNSIGLPINTNSSSVSQSLIDTDQQDNDSNHSRNLVIVEDDTKQNDIDENKVNNGTKDDNDKGQTDYSNSEVIDFSNKKQANKNNSLADKDNILEQSLSWSSTASSSSLLSKMTDDDEEQSSDGDESDLMKKLIKKIKNNVFPMKLWHLASNDDFDPIKWTANGSVIEINIKLLQPYLSQITRSSKFSSFLRQMHLYRFRKTSNFHSKQIKNRNIVKYERTGFHRDKYNLVKTVFRK